MSGCTDTSPCPICGTSMTVYTDWKPVDIVWMECGHCGFDGYMKFGMRPEHDRQDRIEDVRVLEPLSMEQKQEYLQVFKKMFGDGTMSEQEQSQYLGLSGAVVEQSVRQKVLISVRGGVAYVEQSPAEIEVEIVDYDNPDETHER